MIGSFIIVSVSKIIAIMPRCAILSCESRKNKNHPELTLHRLPKNNVLRQKWIDIIGSNNLNYISKCIYICSIHFEESCFNRTLDVIRLQDNSVPSLHLPAQEFSVPLLQPSISKCQELNNQPISSTTNMLSHRQSEKIKKLTKRCIDHRKTIKRLAETIRRREKKIAELDDKKRELIEQIKMRKLVISE